jgi:hypothetical protein
MNTLVLGQDVSGQLPGPPQAQSNTTGLTGDHLWAFEHISNAPGDDARTFGVDCDATGDHLQACGYLSKTFASIVCFIRDS